MPYVWSQDENQEWKPAPLTDDPMELADTDEVSSVCVVRARDGRPGDRWVLVWGRERSVRFNGLRVPTGIRVLADRDEVAIDSNPPVFFTTEELARVEKFEAGDVEMFCPRCKKTLEDGADVVRCPECSIAFHYSADADRDCYGYAPTCTCGHTTALDAGFKWTPYDVWS